MTDLAGRVVVVANGRYATLPELERAVPDAEELARLLEIQQHFQPTVLPNLDRAAILDAIDEHLGEGTLNDGTLIVAWIGHGKVGPDGTLRLLGYGEPKDVEVGRAGDLGEWAARTGARQVLILIDTCYSGGGLVDAVRLASAVNEGRASPGTAWFGVLAASLADEPARSGALIRELVRLLNEGPREPELRWDKTRPYIRGDDLVQTLITNWSETRQTPFPISAGRAGDFVRNPNFQAGLPDQPVDHLLLAARGGHEEQGFFSGRASVIREIVAWLRRGEPGLFVLTGPQGYGKSAVAGRIASLSSTTERARVLAAETVPADLDPGPSSVHAQLHARGLTPDSGSERLARQLGTDIDAGPYGVLAEARRRRKEGQPLVIIVDGLDEAGKFGPDLAVQLLAPLARDALVLVATRDVPSGETTLIAQLGPAARTVDLGQDIDGIRQDVKTYVRRRLAGVSANMDPELVAEALTLADRDMANAPFLLARLVTAQLRDHPVDTSADGWQLTIAATVESALERDLQSVAQSVAATMTPVLLREMLHALALAYGSGFPADDVWPAVASALSASGTTYTRDDAFSVLEAMGPHIMAGLERDQPVYRIAHQRLVDYLKRDLNAAAAGARAEPIAVAVGNAILTLYEQILDAGLGPRANTYLWRYAWRHLAEAGPSGIAGLRRLAERDREAFLPDLTDGLELVASTAWSDGRATEALAYIEDAVTNRRALADNFKLAATLFHLALFRSAMGDDSGADEAARDAATCARAVGDTRERRIILNAALLTHAATQTREGHWWAGQRLADEVIALNEGEGAADDEDAWLTLTWAYMEASRAAFLGMDLEKAARQCQTAVDLIDKHATPDQASMLLMEPLATLATIQFTQSSLAAPDSDGRYPPAITAAAERSLREYRRLGRSGTLTDVLTSKGITAYMLACLLDRSRGLNVGDSDDHSALLDDAIELARPYAQQVADAAFVFQTALSLRATQRAETDQLAAAADRIEAEECLRRFSARSVLAAATLGQLITVTVAAETAKAQNGTAVDLSRLTVRQQEAVALLRNGPIPTRPALASALGMLAYLMALGGGTAMETAIRDEAIDVWRSLPQVSPDVQLQLALLLVQQSARLLAVRTADAAEMAREALELADVLPQPQAPGIAAQAMMILAAAGLTMGGRPDDRQLLEGAIDRLDPLSSQPSFAGALASARLCLAQIELEAGASQDALVLAEKAVAVLDLPGVGRVMAANGPVATIARLILGNAQCRVGLDDAGTATLRDSIGALAKAVVSGSHEPRWLAEGLNTYAAELWDTVLAELVDHSDLHQTLQLMRWRPDHDLHLTVERIVTALASAEPARLGMLHSIARMQRSRTPDAFDVAWRDAAGAVPSWLCLDPAQVTQTVAWLCTPTWAHSRDYLKAHPKLLDVNMDIVLEELGISGIDAVVLNSHKIILATVRSEGLDTTYAPLLARVDIAAWENSADREHHLAEHDELFRPEVAAELRARAATGDPTGDGLLAVLDLSRRGERRLAFEVAAEPAASFPHLSSSWRSRDVARLAALATVLRSWAEDAQTRGRATTALAIARVLEGRADEAEALIDVVLEAGSEVARKDLIADLQDAIQSHPTAAGGLGRLIEQLSASEVASTDT